MHVESIYKSIKSAHSQLYKNFCKKKRHFSFMCKMAHSFSQEKIILSSQDAVRYASCSRAGASCKTGAIWLCGQNQRKTEKLKCNTCGIFLGIRQKDTCFHKFTHHSNSFGHILLTYRVKNRATFPKYGNMYRVYQ